MNGRLGLAVLLPFLALALQWLLWPWIAPLVWFLFFPAVFFSARSGGLVGGLVSTVLSTGLVWFFFIPPQLSWAMEDPSNLFSVGLFLFMGYLFSSTHEHLRRAQMKSETRFAATFEQAAVGIAQVAPDGRWLRVNRKLCEIVGYTQEELLSKAFQDITHPDDLDSDLDQVRRMLAREIDTYSMEKRYIRKDGSITWINLTAALTWKPDGMPDYFISVVEDIQARKQAEAALCESEERLQLFIQHAPAALAMFDQEMRYLVVSRRWLADYGLGNRDIIGRSHYEIFPEVPDSWKDVHRRGLGGEVVEAAEDPFERTDGTIHWLRWVVRPWRTAAGAVGGIVIFTEDISARKQAQSALLEHQADTLEEQRRAQLAALNLMEDAVAARQRAETTAAALRESERRLLMAQEGRPCRDLGMGPAEQSALLFTRMRAAVRCGARRLAQLRRLAFAHIPRRSAADRCPMGKPPRTRRKLQCGIPDSAGNR